MSETKLVFLSHASADKHFVHVLANIIESTTNNFIRVFASSKPEDIPSSEEWLSTVFSKLDEAKGLVVIITPTSLESPFVMFEVGYFWHKHGGKNIYALYHPTAPLPMPLASLQGKCINSAHEIEVFLRSLSTNLECKYQPPAIILLEELVAQAQLLRLPPQPNSLERFEVLLDDPSLWNEEHIDDNQLWICASDSGFRIVPAWNEKHQEYSEPWTKGFPDPHCSRYRVHLMIAGQSVKEVFFISLDGGRYFVPMPEVRLLASGGVEYYWNKHSLEMKLFQIVGNLYSHFVTIQGFASKQGIVIYD